MVMKIIVYEDFFFHVIGHYPPPPQPPHLLHAMNYVGERSG